MEKKYNSHLPEKEGFYWFEGTIYPNALMKLDRPKHYSSVVIVRQGGKRNFVNIPWEKAGYNNVFDVEKYMRGVFTKITKPV